jgi:hypothetical protein
MSESDARRDDDQGEAAPADERADWNTPEIEDDADKLPVAVQRVLASDQHLTERRVFYGQAEADEEEAEAEAPQ